MNSNRLLLPNTLHWALFYIDADLTSVDCKFYICVSVLNAVIADLVITFSNNAMSDPEFYLRSLLETNGTQTEYINKVCEIKRKVFRN